MLASSRQLAGNLRLPQPQHARLAHSCAPMDASMGRSLGALMCWPRALFAKSPSTRQSAGVVAHQRSKLLRFHAAAVRER